jgi:acetyl esterase
MRVSFRVPAKWAAVLVVVLGVTLTASGCAPAAPTPIPTPSAHHITIGPAAYPHFPAYANVRIDADQTYERVDGQAMLLDVCMPSGDSGVSRPAILAIHGGGWTHGSKTQSRFRDVCEWLASAGFVAASVNYRLAPKYEYPDAIRDVERAVEWLRKAAQVRRYSIDPTKIGVLGSSAGGNLGALLGTEGSGSLTTGHRVAAVADLSGPIDLTAEGAEKADLLPNIEEYLGCANLASCPQARVASPSYHVDPTDPPFFVANSTNELIPLSQPENFVSALRAAGVAVRFVEVNGNAHAVKMLHSSLRDEIIDFFRTTLGDPRGHVGSVTGR